MQLQLKYWGRYRLGAVAKVYQESQVGDPTERGGCPAFAVQDTEDAAQTQAWRSRSKGSHEPCSWGRMAVSIIWAPCCGGPCNESATIWGLYWGP